MAERKSGLPVDPTSPLISQILSPLVPMSYQVDKPYSVDAQEVDGAYIYSENPMQVSDPQFGTPPIISGGIDFFKSLIEDPTGTASGIATAVSGELEELPKRQIRTALGGGETYNPDTGEVERFDPLSIPATTALGTAASIARVADDGSTVLGIMGGRRAQTGSAREATAKSLKAMGKSEDDIFRANKAFFDSEVLGSDVDAFRFEIPTKNSSLNPNVAGEVDISYGSGTAFGLKEGNPTGFFTEEGDLYMDPAVSKITRLGDVLDFEELYTEYPEMRGVEVIRLVPRDLNNPFEKAPEAFFANADESPTGAPLIGISDVGDPKTFQSILLHEVQHGVQNLEGLPRGGSAKQIFDQLVERYPEVDERLLQAKAIKSYETLYGETEARVVQNRFENPDEALLNPVASRRKEMADTDVSMDELDAVDRVDEDDLLEEAAAYNDEGIAPFAGMIGKGISESRLPTSNQQVKSFGFYQDNPDIARGNNDYTRENIEYLEQTRPEGDDYLRGPQTALLGVDLPNINVKAEKPFTLPSSFVNDLPGAMNETRMAGDPKFDRLMESVREEGFDPDQKGNRVVVGVNHLGQAYVLEGNTRAAVAAASGVPNIRAEVRYFNGSEMVDGPFSPQNLSRIADQGPRNEGIAPFAKLIGQRTNNSFSDFDTSELITSWVIDPTKVSREEVASRLLSDRAIVAKTNQALDTKGYGDTVPMFRLVKLTNDGDFQPEELISATLDPNKVPSNVKFLTEGKFGMSTPTDYRLVRYDVPRDRIAGYLPAISGDIKQTVNRAVKDRGIGQEKVAGTLTVTNPAKHAKDLISLQDEIIADVSGLKPTVLSDNAGKPMNMLSMGGSLPKLIAEGKVTSPEDISEALPSYTALNPVKYMREKNTVPFEEAEYQARQELINTYQDFFGIQKKAKGGPVRAGIGEFIPLLQKGFEGRSMPNFIRRTLDPKSPMTEEGSTVRLMDFEYGGKYLVAPTIFPINTPQGPRLTELPGDMAVNHALQTGEFLQFDTPEEAARVAQGYSGTINTDRPKQAGIGNFIPYMQ